MDDGPQVNPPDNPDLQFDRAEPIAPPRVPAAHAPGAIPSATVRCVACKRPVGAAYYTSGTKTVCPPCRSAFETAMAKGSRAGRFVKASLCGALAAILGAGIYYAIAAATGYELGLIAILVGFLVGKSVRWGTGGGGGRGYQLLAAFLTYCAVDATYFLPLFQEAMKQAQHSSQTTSGAGGAAQPDPKEKAHEKPSAPRVALATVELIGLLLALPFLLGFQNAMGWIIIGIAVYQAWVINRPLQISFAGPFRVGPAAAGGPIVA